MLVWVGESCVGDTCADDPDSDAAAFRSDSGASLTVLFLELKRVDMDCARLNKDDIDDDFFLLRVPISSLLEKILEDDEADSKIGRDPVELLPEDMPLPIIPAAVSDSAVM